MKAQLTLERLRQIAKKLKACEIKPYKGFLGLCSQGLFEIKNNRELEKLKAGLNE